MNNERMVDMQHCKTLGKASHSNQLYNLCYPTTNLKSLLSPTAAKINSSVMIRYGVDDRASIPGRRIDFSIRHPFQTGSTA
jgi:hypothetical protein